MRRSIGEKAFIAFNYVFLSLSTIICVAPMLYILMASFISPNEYLAHGISFPRRFSLYNYIYLLGVKNKVTRGLAINIYITVVATALNVIFTFITAYVISKKYLLGVTKMTFFMYSTVLFSGGLIPFFLWMRFLGFSNSLWVLIVPGLITPGYCLLIRNYLVAIPASLEESAKIDGANDLVIMFQVIMPLSLPVVATIGLFYAVEHWNEWFNAMIFLSDSNKYPLQLVLRYFLVNRVMPVDPEQIRNRALVEVPSDILKMTAIVISMFPILCAYPFVQKYFIKSIIAGSVKG